MRPLALIIVSAVLLLVWLVLMTVAVWYFYGYWEARLTLRDHVVRLRLPEGLEALAEVDAPLHTRLNLQPVVKVPIDQVIQAEISDQIEAQVQLSTVLPVDTSVTVDQVVPVKTTLNLSLSLRSWLPAIPVTVPLTLQLPVHMVVPIKAQVPVALDIQVSGNLPPTLSVPVRQTFTVRPLIHSGIDVRLVSQTAFKLRSPLEPFLVTIERADLAVPFDLDLLRQRPASH